VGKSIHEALQLRKINNGPKSLIKTRVGAPIMIEGKLPIDSPGCKITDP
jgi:hypothetical protein